MTARELEERHALEGYPRRGISIVRGEDARLWDDQGNEYLDCAAGVGVANVGHANPAVAAALADQARVLVTCPGIFYSGQRGQLLEKLAIGLPNTFQDV